MSDVAVGGQFGHVFLIFNTLFNLPDQDAQVRCFRNVARVLVPGGTFLIEVFVPGFEDYAGDQRVRTMRLDMDSVWIEATIHDRKAQKIEAQRLRISQKGMELVPLPLRYAYPPELDLMAKLAGLELESRWGGWKRESFDQDSAMHVSLYRKPTR